ncbi:MAG: hypothetical protein PUG37_07345 [Bacillales bacterium]|nr:hypothetical protein [Bacillales bacterium]
MIYSINFEDMTKQLNPFAVCQYLELNGWKHVPFKREDVKVYQVFKDNNLVQVNVPTSKELYDYKEAMYDVVKVIATFEEKSLEQVMLYLLNPNTDIIKIRFIDKEVANGNILLDDAIKLFDNAKKLIAATAADVINPQKIHYGRADKSVLTFLNQCRFGQTEIGSYVVSVVCPFAELSTNQECQQLSIFSDEENCENSLTRKVTSRLIDNIATVKEKIETGDFDALSSEDNEISSNFLEALSNFNLGSENSSVIFTPEWSPMAKKNRSSYKSVAITSDYYQPITAAVQKIKEKTKKQTEIIGKISRLKAAPSVDNRNGGEVVIIFLNENNRAKSVKAFLCKEDYEKAVDAHQYGKMVKIIGTLTKNSRPTLEDAIFVSLE